MVTRLNDLVDGFEIWRRFLEEWEPVNRGRYRAMLTQLLQYPLTGSRGQALEWERPVRQYEAQNLDTATQPQDSEWCRYVRLSVTRLQRHGALESVAKRNAKARASAKRQRQGIVKEKGKNKEKGKSKDARDVFSAKKKIVPSP